MKYNKEMDIKENILNCVAQVNKLLSEKGATLFNPTIILVNQKFTTLNTVTSVTADLIRSVLGKPNKDFEIRYQNDVGSHARILDNEIIFDATSLEQNESSFYTKLLKPIGSKLSVDFIMYHEMTHILQGQYWNKKYYDESKKEISSLLYDLDTKYKTFAEDNIKQRLAILKGPKPVDYNLIEELKEIKQEWEDSTEGQLCKTISNQRSESWADCFSLLMIYKTHGVEEFKKVLSHVINFREQSLSLSFKFDLSKNKVSPFTHNTSQALFELKKAILDDSVEDLSFEGMNNLIASCVTKAIAKDLYKNYYIDIQVQEFVDKEFKSSRADLFSVQKNFAEISSDLFSDYELNLFNHFANDAKIIKDIIRLPGVSSKLMNTSLENILEDIEFKSFIKNAEPISKTHLITLSMTHLMVKLVEDKEHTIVDSGKEFVLLDKIIDFEIISKHTEALMWVYKSGALDIKVLEEPEKFSLIYKEPSSVPIKKIRDKLLSGIFYKDPEKISLKK